MSDLDATANVGPSRDFASQWERWHREHERRRASSHGFLAITGLHWLDHEPQRFDDVPGAWSSEDDGVRVILNEDEELTIDDVTVVGRYRFENVDEHGRSASFGDAIVEVCRRDPLFMIRPRDPNNAVRAGYRGTPTYEPSTDWVAHGRLIPIAESRRIDVGTSVEGLKQNFSSPGEVEFALGGHTHHLVAFGDDESDELFIVFKDETSGDTTYPACRFLYVDAPDADGRVTLDFNRATNPPCAYTDFATCPLPPSGNDLPVRVEAGEKTPTTSH